MPKLEDPIHINIAQEFSTIPGPRRREEGEHSGEEFLEKILKPRFQKAVEENRKLFVDLDGTEGYATSFLEASFGGLARKYDIQLLLDAISFKSEDEPYLIDHAKEYIRKARD